jgi:hypothetical protein
MGRLYLYLIALVFAVLIVLPAKADGDAHPDFSLTFECVLRGPYEGMAQAWIGYEYSGEFQVTPEDSRLLGDTATGATMVLNYPIEPGKHEKALIVNVGAQKVVTLKIILFGDLYVVTAYDNPDIPDCAWATPEPTMEATSNA